MIFVLPIIIKLDKKYFLRYNFRKNKKGSTKVSDILKVFHKIGSIYESDKEAVKNNAHKYNEIKVYLFDIQSKEITPHSNISKDDLIVTRFSVGSNSGSLFPNQFFNEKTKYDLDKFIKGILQACKNLLSKFNDEKIKQNEILTILKTIDKNFFETKLDEISKLQEYKIKGSKVATYFSLSYKEKPVSAYFKELYKDHISKAMPSEIYGYDIFTNEKGIGADAHLAFCSVNELPENLQYIKSRLLPLKSQNANLVKIGYDVMDKKLSHTFHGIRMAILPTILTDDTTIIKEILKILEDTQKNNINKISDSEEIAIDLVLENSSTSLKEYPVLATILFYEKVNAAVNLFLSIDDVLPSYISHVANTLMKYNIKAFYEKDRVTKETIYIQNLFYDIFETMQILLTDKKIKLDILLDKFKNLILYGSNNKFKNNIEWEKYFNNYYYDRNIETLQRYVNLFNELGKINFTLKKEINVENLELKDKIESLIKSYEFLENENLKSAYLLGMLCAAVINWQIGVSQKSSFASWLNNIGVINKQKLEKIYQKCDEAIRKISSVSKKQNKNINQIKEILLKSLPKTLSNGEIAKTSYITVAFAMGGSDFSEYIKNKKDQGENDA